MSFKSSPEKKLNVFKNKCQILYQLYKFMLNFYRNTVLSLYLHIYKYNTLITCENYFCRVF